MTAVTQLSQTPVPGTSDVHIVPVGSSWAIKQERMPRYTLVARTQQEVIALGVQMARHGAVSLIIHGRNGQFREVRSYR